MDDAFQFSLKNKYFLAIFFPYKSNSMFSIAIAIYFGAFVSSRCSLILRFFMVGILIILEIAIASSNRWNICWTLMQILKLELGVKKKRKKEKNEGHERNRYVNSNCKHNVHLSSFWNSKMEMLENAFGCLQLRLFCSWLPKAKQVFFYHFFGVFFFVLGWSKMRSCIRMEKNQA